MLHLRRERSGHECGARRRARGVSQRGARACRRASPTTWPRCRRDRSGSRSPTGCAVGCSTCLCRSTRATLDDLVAAMSRDVLPVRDGQRSPGVLWLGQPAAVPGRRHRFADGSGDESERCLWRSRRRAPRARGGALAGRAGRLSARAGRGSAHQRRVGRDDRLPRRRPWSRAGGGRPRRAARRPRRRAAAHRLRAGRSS